jgi:hypothetical protein
MSIVASRAEEELVGGEEDQGAGECELLEVQIQSDAGQRKRRRTCTKRRSRTELS